MTFEFCSQEKGKPRRVSVAGMRRLGLEFIAFESGPLLWAMTVSDANWRKYLESVAR